MYQEEIPTAQLVQKLASVIQEYTQSGWEEIIEKKKEKEYWVGEKREKKDQFWYTVVLKFSLKQ